MKNLSYFDRLDPATALAKVGNGEGSSPSTRFRLGYGFCSFNTQIFTCSHSWHQCSGDADTDLVMSDDMPPVRAVCLFDCIPDSDLELAVSCLKGENIFQIFIFYPRCCLFALNLLAVKTKVQTRGLCDGGRAAVLREQ